MQLLSKKWEMVCDKCTERLSKVCVPDKWKEGAGNTGKVNVNLFYRASDRSYYPVTGGGVKAGKTNKVRFHF